MAIVAGDDVSEAETALLDDVVRGSVNFKGIPARRSKSGSWKSASFIIGVEGAERFAYCGISSNLINYLTGPLGQSTAAAAENVNAWGGTSMLLPLLGAFIADSFLGRYRTIIIASVVYILGLGFLSLSPTFHSSNSYACKNDANNVACSPPSLEVLFFFFSLYLVAFAQGGHKPCVQAFGADQFDEEDERELKAKSSFFNWWYFTMNGGMFVAILVLSYVQDNLSWELGFGIPCIVMCLALIVFLLGSTTYRFRVNSDKRNPFVRIGWVFVRAAKNWNSSPTVIYTEREYLGILPLEGTKFKFLDKAIPASDDGTDRNVCTIGDVADAKSILRLVPIWCTCLGYAIAFSQSSTLFTKQAATMDRHIAFGFKIPSASMQSLISVSIMLVLPIYDCILVPIVRGITKKPAGISMLQRIGTGIFLSVLLMVIAALVERRRLATAVEHGLVEDPNATIPMSVWWLAPQYLILGIADAFTMVGLQEFFYDQVPTELKSLGLALYLTIFGIGSFLSSFLISIIEKATSGDGRDSWFSNNLNRAHLDYFYWLLGGISAITTVAYAYCAKSYTYKRKDKF
ncbi:hypothetical protein ACS0TY_027983 [Phlomoides rotata]